MTHTPGPWVISRGAQADAFAIEAATRTVAHIKTVREAEANARLIAAAPDLLAAVRYWFDAKATPGELARMARAAIAKAEGRQP